MARYWFRPKKYGIGAGLPISWEGWALLAGYFGLCLLLIVLTPLLFGVQAAVAAGAITVATSLALTVISAAKTEGGWRWRWGED